MYWRKVIYNGSVPRSKKWPSVRNAFLKKNPSCAACGNKKLNELEVHHIRPYYAYPFLELKEENLIVLCEGSGNCHFVWGHLLNWRVWNLSVRKDAKAFLNKIKKRQTNDLESEG